MSELKIKKVSDSYTEQVYMIRSQHINGYGRLFGGYLCQWMDELAVVVARRHSGREVTTAAIDNLNFKAGANMGDMVVLVGRVTYVGNSSMEIRVDAYTEDSEGIRRSINRAYFVMVAIDDKGKSVKVNSLAIENEMEKAEWESGEKRYKLRKQRRVEGF